jgi:hypothetical protein
VGCRELSLSTGKQWRPRPGSKSEAVTPPALTQNCLPPGQLIPREPAAFGSSDTGLLWAFPGMCHAHAILCRSASEAAELESHLQIPKPWATCQLLDEGLAINVSLVAGPCRETAEVSCGGPRSLCGWEIRLPRCR